RSGLAVGQLLGGAQVVPGREVVARAEQRDHVDVVVGARLGEGGVELLEEHPALGVAVLGAVDGDAGDVVGDLVADEAAHRRSFARARRRRAGSVAAMAAPGGHGAIGPFPPHVADDDAARDEYDRLRRRVLRSLPYGLYVVGS